MICILNAGAEKPLYSKVLNINVKGPASDDIRLQKFSLDIEWIPNSTSHKRVLAVHLTDSNDPFFYYKANIAEEDFLKMKQQQDLLVDFKSFAEMFTNLLEKCVAEDARPQPKFILSLYMESHSEAHRTALLDIVKKDPFKHIVHLSILLPEVTNLLQKQYITVCYRNMKEGKERLENTLSSIQHDLTKQLQNCQETSSNKVHELEDIIKRKDDEFCKEMQKAKDELQQQKGDLLKKHKDEILMLESKLRRKENSHKSDLHEQEVKVKCLEGLNKEYTDKLNEKSKTIRELKLKLDSLQTANQETRNCLKAVEKENEELQNLLDIKEQKIIQFSGEKYSLQLKVNEKEEMNTQLHQNLESVTKEKGQLKQQLSKLESQYSKIEENNEQLKEDVYKSNDIIGKLGRKFKELKEKLKVKEKIIHKNEESQAKKTKNFEETIQGLTDQIKAAERDKHEVEKLKSKFAAMEKELLEHREAITLKNNIIKHLDDQLLNNTKGQDSPWNGEISNKGCFPKVVNEAALPSNQVPREHCLDSRYFQRHQPLTLHNPMDEEEPSYLRELYTNPSDPQAPFLPLAQEVYISECRDRMSNHRSLSKESNRSGRSNSRSPSCSRP